MAAGARAPKVKEGLRTGSSTRNLHGSRPSVNRKEWAKSCRRGSVNPLRHPGLEIKLDQVPNVDIIPECHGPPVVVVADVIRLGILRRPQPTLVDRVGGRPHIDHFLRSKKLRRAPCALFL